MRKSLEPIAENKNANIIDLMQRVPSLPNQKRLTSSRRSDLTELSQVDNGITFLNNGQKIVNPTNMRTPPPPMWGDPEVIDYDGTEEFYNHQEALK